MSNPPRLLPALFLTLALAASALPRAGAVESTHPPITPVPATEPTLLSFNQLLEPTAHAPRPTAEAKRLVGKRVKMQGFMARTEEPQIGGFFLCPHPLLLDESGGGSGELPPHCVLVVVRGDADHEIPFTPRLLSLTGVLQLGREENQGRITWIRILLDRPEDLRPSPATPAPAAGNLGAAPVPAK